MSSTDWQQVYLIYNTYSTHYLNITPSVIHRVGVFTSLFHSTQQKAITTRSIHLNRNSKRGQKQDQSCNHMARRGRVDAWAAIDVTSPPIHQRLIRRRRMVTKAAKDDEIRSVVRERNWNHVKWYCFVCE